MLHYAVFLSETSLIAAVFRFSGRTAGAAGMAKILFVLLLIGAAITYSSASGTGHETPAALEKRIAGAMLELRNMTPGRSTMERMADTVKRGRGAEANGGENAGSAEWRKLVADVEDLVKKVANVDDAEIAEIRGKVEATLARAKNTAGEGAAALREGAAAVRERAGEVSQATDEYVRDNPWAAIGIAAAIGIVVGFVAGRR